MSVPERTLDDLLEEVQRLFGQQLSINYLLSLSKQLQAEIKNHLVSSPQCMLPSFNYTLPTGKEHGIYLALEVGGSNLRMSLVELNGRDRGTESIRIRRTLSFPISHHVRHLEQHAFFDWMAERTGELLALEGGAPPTTGTSRPLRMGIAWSFPIKLVCMA